MAAVPAELPGEKQKLTLHLQQRMLVTCCRRKELPLALTAAGEPVRWQGSTPEGKAMRPANLTKQQYQQLLPLLLEGEQCWTRCAYIGRHHLPGYISTSSTCSILVCPRHTGRDAIVSCCGSTETVCLADLRSQHLHATNTLQAATMLVPTYSSADECAVRAGVREGHEPYRYLASQAALDLLAVAAHPAAQQRSSRGPRPSHKPAQSQWLLEVLPEVAAAVKAGLNTMQPSLAAHMMLMLQR
jgi:hypothetical protein